jgi:hypothetical protein
MSECGSRLLAPRRALRDDIDWVVYSALFLARSLPGGIFPS